MISESKARVRWDKENNGFRISFVFFGVTYVLYSSAHLPWTFTERHSNQFVSAFPEGHPLYNKCYPDVGVMEALMAFKKVVLQQRRVDPRVTSKRAYEETARRGFKTISIST